jgi:hypothetical protein
MTWTALLDSYANCWRKPNPRGNDFGQEKLILTPCRPVSREFVNLVEDSFHPQEILSPLFRVLALA